MCWDDDINIVKQFDLRVARFRSLCLKERQHAFISAAKVDLRTVKIKFLWVDVDYFCGMRSAAAILVLIGLNARLLAQVVPDTGDFVDYINTYVSNLPGTSGNDYKTPSVDSLATWGRIIALMADGSYSEAADSAALLDYRIVEFVDTTTSPDATYYLLENTGSNYWGSVAFNPSYCRPLVIQSPHPGYDFRTGQQGAYVFRETESYVFCISGTHRCNNASFSTCAGTTTVCGGSSAFRISDQPHVVNSTFQTTTDTLFNRYSNTYFIQLHGFTMGAGDPYVILSNGTRDTPTVDYISSLANYLYAEDNVLTFKIAHIDTNWTDNVGFTNTQGRLINGSGNPCNSSASSTTGRFLHIEQEKFSLRNDQAGWTKMANALSNTFSCGALPVELVSFSGSREQQTIQLNWSTASELNSDYFEVWKLTDGGNWLRLDTIPAAGFSTDVTTYRYIDHHAYTSEQWYKLTQADFDGQSHLMGILRIAEQSKPRIQVVPVPASDVLHIVAHNRHLPYRYSLLNSMGIEVLSGVLENDRIPLSNVPPGYYTLVLDFGGTSTTHKVIVQKN